MSFRVKILTDQFKNGQPLYFVRRNGIGWGSLSLVNAGLAEQKGRDKFSWGLLSLILGPLATAYIVFTNPKYPRIY